MPVLKWCSHKADAINVGSGSDAGVVSLQSAATNSDVDLCILVMLNAFRVD